MDPVLEHIIAFSLSLLFASAALQKLRANNEFAETLSAYQILPAGFVGMAAAFIPVIELGLSLALLIPATQSLAALLTSATLAVYATAIWLNIVRGNLSLDCGCQLGSGRQKISMGLVARNTVLAILALLLLAPTSDRVLAFFDYGTMFFGFMVSCLFYSILNIQLANAASYREIKP